MATWDAPDDMNWVALGIPFEHKDGRSFAE